MDGSATEITDRQSGIIPELSSVVFGNPNIDHQDLRATAAAFISSGLAFKVYRAAQDDGRELGGAALARPGGFSLVGLRWGAADGSEVKIPELVGEDVSKAAFYVHSHNDALSAGSLSVAPGPSKEDMDNSFKLQINQVVIDVEGYVYAIDQRGDLLKSDGSVLPRATAIQLSSRVDAAGRHDFYPSLENHANALGRVRRQTPNA